MNRQPSKVRRRNHPSNVEDRQQTLSRLRRPFAHFGLQPLFGPLLFTAVEHRQHKIVFRFEMPIQRHLGNTGTLDDGVDSYGADAVAAEQGVGRRHDPLPR